ncbi:MAG: carbamoyltransferase C-terminal domain-containing protein [Pseudomonadota bacterium]|nr:carbamoyltransferase C-terminal domain-containing protein [Pseudomonadota bacterium]
MIILGLNLGIHDGAASIFNDYSLVAAVQLERLTRIKGDGNGLNQSCIDEVLRIAGLSRLEIDAVAFSRAFLPTKHLDLGLKRNIVYALRRRMGADVHKDIAGELKRSGQPLADRLVKRETLIRELGLRSDVTVFFANHHFSHALSSLFYTECENALLYTADGCGDNVHYSVRFFDGKQITPFYGDDRWLLRDREINSLGLAYGYATQSLGYKINRHEGKLTGLAAFGKPTLYESLSSHFTVTDDGVIHSRFASFEAMKNQIRDLSKDEEPANVAASIQKLLEDYVSDSVCRFVEQTGAEHLALAGGVFANVSLNRILGERTGVKDFFIFPGMGDEGLAIGNVLHYLLAKDGLVNWMKSRRHLQNVYWGGDYSRDLQAALSSSDDLKQIAGSPADIAAQKLADGAVGAIYEGRTEFGPRALGARSILARPSDKNINAELNDRLQRTEFMPFAPVVLEQTAQDVFNINESNAYACRFMTVTCDVKSQWRERIPAVVHIDGTARPQTISRSQNPLYHDVLERFYEVTGIPVLVNTSFNAHEEPIINSPSEALAALRTNRVDFLISRFGVFERQ